MDSLQDRITEARSANLDDYVTKDAERRDRDAAERHRELLRAIEKSTDTIVKAIDGGFRAIADAIRSR